MLSTRHSPLPSFLAPVALVALGLLPLLASCSSASGPDPEPDDPVSGEARSFRMGFTPWPYAATAAAVEDVYGKILSDGDVIAHHLDGGVPWPEAFAGTAYHPNVEAQLAGRVARTPADVPVYLAVTPVASGRDGLAGYWAAGTGLPRPGEWAGRDLDDPEVVTAFVNYALDLIDRFDPTWFNYGIEVTELALNAPPGWVDQLERFAAQVHPRLRAAHPELPIFVSGGFRSPDSADAAAIRAAWQRILPYSDLIGVSLYPYVFFQHRDRGDPGNLPVDWLGQAAELDPTKPLAIAETGWIAERLEIPEFGVDVAADPADQEAYLDMLLTEAERLNAAFVTWFFAVDYDVLWEGPLARDPVARIWRDTGLWDESVNPRPALEVWRAWLERDPPPASGGAPAPRSP